MQIEDVLKKLTNEEVKFLSDYLISRITESFKLVESKPAGEGLSLFEQVLKSKEKESVTGLCKEDSESVEKLRKNIMNGVFKV